MKKKLSVLLVTLLLTSLFTGCGAKPAPAPATPAPTAPAPAPAPTEAYNLKIGFAESDTSPHYKGYQKIAENIEKASNGAIKVTLYPSNQLGNERDLYEGMQVGTIDAAIVTNSILPNFIPETAVLDQPFLFPSVEAAHKVIDGKFGEMIKEKSAAVGVQILGWCDSGFRDIFSAKPINSIGDIKGLKIRTMENKMHMAAYNAIGAIATPMAFSDVFTAIQQGTVDGYENSVANMYANRFYEVCKYGVRSRMHFAFQPVCFSNKYWDSIPQELKPAIVQGIKEGADLQRQYLEEANNAYVSELTDKLSVQIIDVDHDALVEMAMPSMSQFNLDKGWNDILLAEIEAASK